MEELVFSTRTEQLQQRSEHCVCKYCGGKLKVKSVVFNDILDARTELYCTHCDRVEHGVEQEIYQSAKYFVEEFDYDIFPDLDDSLQARQMAIAKVCEIMSWVVKYLGYTDATGFRVPPTVNMNLVGECLHLTDKELTEDLHE